MGLSVRKEDEDDLVPLPWPLGCDFTDGGPPDPLHSQWSPVGCGQGVTSPDNYAIYKGKVALTADILFEEMAKD